MNESQPKHTARRGRIFPELTISPQELARRKTEREALHQRCRTIFEQVRPQFLDKHYGWYIAIEPESGDYFIDEDIETTHQKALNKYPNTTHCVFCLNELGVTGTI
ncbi:MAG: hypothetical protein AAF757_25200 [Cyanobacteria bacterium P01_D01_bin.116]